MRHLVSCLLPADVVSNIEEEEAGHGHVELGGPQGVGRHGGDNLQVDRDAGVLRLRYAGGQRCRWTEMQGC